MALGKKFLIILVLFSAGFLTHALLFPDVLSNGVILIPDAKEQTTDVKEQKNTARNIFTNITFDGKHFSRTNVTLRVSDYIIITNTSKNHPMWLMSDTKPLATNRDFLESEQIKEKIDNKGTYIIKEKYTGQKILITVK